MNHTDTLLEKIDKKQLDWSTASDHDKNAFFAKLVLKLPDCATVVPRNYLTDLTDIFHALEQHNWKCEHFKNSSYIVTITDYSAPTTALYRPHKTYESGECASFNEAAMIALLRAEGVEVKDFDNSGSYLNM
jgi:hypothetical protein